MLYSLRTCGCIDWCHAHNCKLVNARLLNCLVVSTRKFRFLVFQVAEVPELPQPVLPDRATCQRRQCMAQLPWEMLTAAIDPAFSKYRQKAGEANPPFSIVADRKDDSWMAMLQQHALLDSNNQSGDHKAEDSSEEWALSDPVKHTVLHLRDFTDPLTPLLAEPLLPAAQPHAGLASQLMRATPEPPVPDYLPMSYARRSVLGSCKATYYSLVGQDMELRDTVTTLPVVLFDNEQVNSYGMDEAESREDTWQQCMTECHIRQLKTGHLKLYMDWSLSDCSACSCKSVQGYKRHLDQALHPAILPPVDDGSALEGLHSAAFVIHSIAGAVMTPPGVPYHAVRQPEQLPLAVRVRLHGQAQQAQQSRHAQQAQQAQQGQQAQHAQHTDFLEGSQKDKGIATKNTRQPTLAVANQAVPKPAPSAAAKLLCDTGCRSVQPAQQDKASPEEPSAPQQMQATGVFQKHQSKHKLRSSARQQVESAGNDMAFFLGLQQGAAPANSASKTMQPRAPALSAAAGAAASSALKAGQPQVLDLCTDDASQDEEEDSMVMSLPDVQYSVLCLPERHQGLLQRMKEEHTLVLRQHAGICAEVSLQMSTIR